MRFNTDDVPIKLPSGDTTKANSNIEVALAYLAATNNQVNRFPESRSGMEVCKVCEHPVAQANGAISNMTIVINVERISTGVGFGVWCRSGVCEKCMSDIVNVKS